VTSTAVRRQRWRNLPVALAMLAPSLVILVTFVLYPLGKAIVLGQQRCDSQGDNCRSNGWDQYWDAFRSEEFQTALLVTAKFALITVPLGLALGVALAVLADKWLRGIGLFRLVFSSTMATSVAVTSLMWLFLLQPEIGALSNVGWISDLFPVVKRPGLLRDPGTALTSIALSSVWASLGFTFILVTASLQGIPRDLQEAAAIDGAGGTRRFWSVTFPLLGPTLLFIVIVLTARAFQAYGEVDLLTGGGPRPQDSTTTITYLTYGQESIIRSNDGLQAAVAVLLFVVLLALSLLQLRAIGKRVHYGS
jgi:sn-glycerol 3-phosphate transport system permease protein